jgi:N-methylhydantoinase A/oxoprolinase/acetone carboxylase beta subunit
MTTQLAVDVGSAFTRVVLHSQTSPDGQLDAGLRAALDASGADWDDVTLLACASTVAGLAPVVQQVLRMLPFRGRVCFMQADASLSSVPQMGSRSGPAAGMLAASSLSRLIGERKVLAVDIGATGLRCAWIREGRLPMATQGVDLADLGPARVQSLQRHAERLGLDPRACTLMVFGGAAASHALELAAGLGCPSVVLPRHAAAFSACGLLQAELRLHHVSERGSDEAVDTVSERLRTRALREVDAWGLAEDDLRFEAREAPGRVELTVSAAITRARLPIRASSDHGQGAAPVVDGVIEAARLQPGTSVAGPALVRDATGLLRLPGQAVLTVDSYGNLIIESAAPERGAPA